jgi:hypothetical protein
MRDGPQLTPTHSHFNSPRHSCSTGCMSLVLLLLCGILQGVQSRPSADDLREPLYKVRVAPRGLLSVRWCPMRCVLFVSVVHCSGHR